MLTPLPSYAEPSALDGARAPLPVPTSTSGAEGQDFESVIARHAQKGSPHALVPKGNAPISSGDTRLTDTKVPALPEARAPQADKTDLASKGDTTEFGTQVIDQTVEAVSNGETQDASPLKPANTGAPSADGSAPYVSLMVSAAPNADPTTAPPDGQKNSVDATQATAQKVASQVSLGLARHLTTPPTALVQQAAEGALPLPPGDGRATAPHALSATPTASVRLPAQTMPAQTMPAQTMPAQTMPAQALPALAAQANGASGGQGIAHGEGNALLQLTPLTANAPHAALSATTGLTTSTIVAPQLGTMDLVQQIRTLNETSPRAGFELRLDPPDLGKLKVFFSNQEGQLTVLLQADRTDTDLLIRRHADTLLHTLRESGFSSVSLGFQDAAERHAQTHTPRDVRPGANNALTEDADAPVPLTSKSGFDRRV